MLVSQRTGVIGATHSGGEVGACFELLQTHGAGVGTKEEDERHEGDVWDKVAGLAYQLSFVLQALCLGEGRPCGIQRLHRANRVHHGQKENKYSNVWLSETVSATRYRVIITLFILPCNK